MPLQRNVAMSGVCCVGACSNEAYPEQHTSSLQPEIKYVQNSIGIAALVDMYSCRYCMPERGLCIIPAHQG